MKLGKKGSGTASSKPMVNSSKKYGLIAVLALVTLLLISWVVYLGRKAQETVDVAVYNKGMYKNQMVTDPEKQFKKYQMLKAEYEKLSITYENGKTVRRIMLWDEVPQLAGYYAAYPLMEGDYVQYRSFIGRKMDNSNTILYNFPGKEVVKFDIDTDLTSTFKTFLEPGDKVNIQATYAETLTEEDDQLVNVGMGGAQGMQKSKKEIDVFRTENAFQGIVIADMLNSKDNSVLDMFAYYNQLSAYEQSMLDNDSEWQDSVQPKTILVALTPEEKERYYYYKNKQATFEVSLPQRTE